MDADETMQRFEALNPEPTTGPDEDLSEIDTTEDQFNLMWAAGEPVRTKTRTYGSAANVKITIL